jgi:hypothetical protein
LLVLLADRLRSQSATSSCSTRRSSHNPLSRMPNGSQTTASKSTPADMVLIKGKIITVDARDSIAEAIDADIAVWDRDLYTIATDDIKNPHCETTIFGGKIVFQTPIRRSP